MQKQISAAKVKAKVAPKRGGRRAHIEELNGGGFKTTLHHAPPANSSFMGGQPPSIEAAHGTYKKARKAVDQHFGMAGAGGAGDADGGDPEQEGV